jgi:hypothetical protein
MKKIALLSLILFVATVSFAQKPAKLKVVYFHAEHRCPTCLSIEENTLKTLNTYFKQQFETGEITFVSLNVEEKKNNAMVEKYQAEGSSLYLTKVIGKTEKTTDFTNFAFSYSRNQPEKFIVGLKEEIEKNLR